jgi:DNA-binding protein H-NS
MSTSSELFAQAQALLVQAEQVRKQELSGVIADIKAKMKEYGITAEDLGGAAARKSPVASKSKAPAKYRGPNGELWSGGPGRKPEWVKAVVASGQDIESFRI